MEQKWREYQKRFRRHKRIARKTPLILFLVSFIILLAAGSPFLDTINLSQKIHYTIEENSLRLRFDEDFVQIDGGFPPLTQERMEEKFVSQLGKDLQVVYTLDPLLQKSMEALFARYRVPYGAFVAISPKTGKVLAMVEYSEEEKGPQHLALRATYPAASIFKLITAAAALEKKKVEPDTVIRFSGGLYALTPRNWVDNPRRDKNKITLADAMGKSCNVAFAKVALRWLNSDELLRYAERFGFNQPVDFEFPVQISQARVENNEASIARTAAGFGDVSLSPMHAALIAAIIANDGKMVAPRIVEKILLDGREIYHFRSREIADRITPDTALKLKSMMTKTVENGTSRHAFYTRRGKAYLKDITVAGKTGSLEGDDPQGDYSWFVGMAPIDDPEIAIAALVINRPVWQIKAPFVAREALLAYFKKHGLKMASLR